jgi:hypothetical protein
MSNNATARFSISTHDNGYYCVSIPKYTGGEVVHAADYDALLAGISRLREALEGLCTAIESRDTVKIWTAMVDARAALSAKKEEEAG